MALIREINNKWFLEHLASFPAPLEKGLHIMADGKTLKMVDPATEAREGEVSCRLVEWQYRIADADHAELELIVEEVVPGFFSSLFSFLTRPLQRLSPDDRGIGTIVIGILTFFALLLAAWTMYKNQSDTWAFAARHLRAFGGWALLILFSFVIPTRLGLYRGRERFQKAFFRVLLMLAGFTLAGVWLRITSLPANFTGSDREYIGYAQALATKFSVSYWPALLVILPWLALSFQAFGLDLAGKTTDTVLKAVKTD
jgi:hypothetical protein